MTLLFTENPMLRLILLKSFQVQPETLRTTELKNACCYTTFNTDNAFRIFSCSWILLEKKVYIYLIPSRGMKRYQTKKFTPQTRSLMSRKSLRSFKFQLYIIIIAYWLLSRVTFHKWINLLNLDLDLENEACIVRITRVVSVMKFTVVKPW